MVAGLPWTTWLLLLASFGAGLAVILPFWLGRRHGRLRGTRDGSARARPNARA